MFLVPRVVQYVAQRGDALLGKTGKALLNVARIRIGHQGMPLRQIFPRASATRRRLHCLHQIVVGSQYVAIERRRSSWRGMIPEMHPAFLFDSHEEDSFT